MKFYILEKDKSIRSTEDVFEWSNFFENSLDRFIKNEHVNDCFVSTVFIGIDQSHGGHSIPLPFETMVFKGDESIYESRSWSVDSALEDHEKAVKWIKDGWEEEAII